MTSNNPLCCLEAAIHEIEGKMPPIGEYPFGHVRYAAEHARLSKVYASVRKLVGPERDPVTGAFNQRQHVSNQIARLTAMLALLPGDHSQVGQRKVLSTELRQWQRIQTAKCTEQVSEPQSHLFALYPWVSRS